MTEKLYNLYRHEYFCKDLAKRSCSNPVSYGWQIFL